MTGAASSYCRCGWSINAGSDRRAAVDRRIGVGGVGEDRIVAGAGRGRCPGPRWPSSWFGPASPSRTSAELVPSRSSTCSDRVERAAAARPRPAWPAPGPAEVEAGVDSFAEPRPGGVVAAVAAVQQLAVADRGGEEEVVAVAAEEAIGAAVVEQGVVAAESRAGRRRRLRRRGCRLSARLRSPVSLPAPPSTISEVVAGSPFAAEGVVTVDPGDQDRSRVVRP